MTVADFVAIAGVISMGASGLISAYPPPDAPTTRAGKLGRLAWQIGRVLAIALGHATPTVLSVQQGTVVKTEDLPAACAPDAVTPKTG